MGEPLKEAVEYADKLRKKKEAEAFISNKAFEIGEHFSNLGLKIDVYIKLELEGEEWTTGNYLNTDE